LTVLTLGLTSSYAADTEDEQWHTPPDLLRMTSLKDAPHSVVMEEVINENTTYSYLYAETYGQSDADFSRYICTSTKAENCKSPTQYAYSAIFPTCASSNDVDCVSALTAIGPDGKEQAGTFSEYAVKNHPNNFPANQQLDIPQGVTGGIWDIPNSPHKFGTQYAVFVTQQGVSNPNKKAQWPESFSTLQARIIPISIAKTMKRDQFWGCTQDKLLSPTYKENTRCGPFYDNNEGFRCVSPYGENNDQCLIAHAFPENTRFKLRVQLSKEPVGWIHGRMIDPNVEISTNAGVSTVTVEANPARIPTVFHAAKWSELPPSVQNFWTYTEKNCNQNSCGYRSSNNYGAPIGEQTTQIQALNYGNSALSMLGVYLPLVNDTAKVSPSTWSWRTLGTNELLTANGCFTEGGGVKGIVTTNASAYSAGPPFFVDGALKYQVAAPHFNPDGTVFKGDYTLILDSKVARCLYGFSNAPISATISVVNDKGEQSVATTTVTEKNGWLRLVARNFEFSSPSISVKLSQEGSASASATTSPTAKQSTITCVKGKTIKKVTATNPTCPKGYKKK